jgi:hypothetical protein
MYMCPQALEYVCLLHIPRVLTHQAALARLLRCIRPHETRYQNALGRISTLPEGALGRMRHGLKMH